MALRLAIYLVGLLIVMAALWLLLVQSGLLGFLPATLAVVVLLLVLGVGLMRGAAAAGPDRVVHEPVPPERVARDPDRRDLP